MRVLVTGSRGYNNSSCILRVLRFVMESYATHARELVLVHGNAEGADKLTAEVARQLGWKVEVHPADWSKGRGAGLARNAEMIDSGIDLCVAFMSSCLNSKCKRLDEHFSHGASHCSALAIKKGITTMRYDLQGRGISND